MTPKILLLFLFVSVALFSEGTEIDSLKKVVAKNHFSSNTAKVETIILLSRKQVYTSPDEAMANGMLALEIAGEAEDKLLIAKAAKHVGTLFFWQSDFKNALRYYNIVLKNNIEADNINGLAASYNNLGVIYNRLGNYSLALENHLQQLKINEETVNIKGIAISNRNIGNIYTNMSEYTIALEYYHKALNISEQLKDTNSLATTLINMGVASMELEYYNQAIQYFNKALSIKIQLDDKRNIGLIYSNLGVVYNSRKDYEIAVDYFHKGLEISKQINHRQSMASAMMNLGDVYLKQGYSKKSYDYLIQALNIATIIDSKQLISDVYNSLSIWYETENDYFQALEYYKKMSVLKDSLLNMEKSKQIKNIQIVYEVEKKEKEILEQSSSIDRLRANQFYLLLAIVVVLFLAFIVYYRYRTKKRLNRQLEVKITEALRKEKEQQQIIVHQSSLTALGELAAGIAHEIKQPLQNISLVNEGLQIESFEESIDNKFVASSAKDIFEGIKRIKFIISEISNFSRGQQEHIMEWFDVNTRIENAFSLARTKFSNRRIDVQFDLNLETPEIQGNPYKFEQVIVNFFNNAKDAIEEKAGKLSTEFHKKMIVRSYTTKGFINIEVEDNGTGVPDASKTKIFLPFFTTKEIGKGTGLGLSISLGIAKEMGGFIEIVSSENTGTLMRLKLPLPKD